MTTYDQSNAECRVFTFKEGLLSAVAHDLELDVSSFEVQVSDDGSSIQASFDARSLRVLHAMDHGRPSSGTISARDKKKIEGNIVDTVLHAKKHPKITFVSTDVSEGSVVGRLDLHGRSREVRLARDGNSVSVTLHQPDFGIKPFSAMLGTLKIKPSVEVKLSFVE